jgi:glycosyltransferase involved in cell wall biosynthesis
MSEMSKNPGLSLIIPNRNSQDTLKHCLEAALSQLTVDLEVIVVDDASEDNSKEIIRGYPFKLIALKEHAGASGARNKGAEAAKGEALFFIDSDCVLVPGAIERALTAYRKNPDQVIGGTYSKRAFDNGFYSNFQAVFINFSETKSPKPDYIASHAMVINRELFLDSGGFKKEEDFLPILEDVEFSHRLKTRGVKLRMEPGLLVEHIFNFDLESSVKNAYRKTRYWVMYSLKNKDLLSDSGTASFELKANTALWGVYTALLAAYPITGNSVFMRDAAMFYVINLFVNIRFLSALFKVGGPAFFIRALIYYTVLYPAPIALGGITGVIEYFKTRES